MPLEGLKLFGSTVKSFSSSLGWGTQKSSVRVSLVQDTFLGDYFLPPPVGAPAYVTFGSLDFWGILQKWEKNYSSEALPGYEILIEDAREILEGSEVILNTYSSNTFGVPNLINVFGYWENALGFGGSQINDSGMPWDLIRTGLLNIINSPIQTNFGGNFRYKGYSYRLDLSQLPVTPIYYRVGGGTNMGLMAIIQQVCEDNGLDFFVDMVPYTNIIRVRTVSRRLQPPVGYIKALVDSTTASGICMNSNVGLEARNETSSAFVVGGEVTTIYEATNLATVHSYFGKDVANNPIIGIGTDYNMDAILNSSEVKDIIGSNSYHCNVLEMSCALSDMNTWLNYMYILKPAFATSIGIINPNVPWGYTNLNLNLTGLFGDIVTTRILTASATESMVGGTITIASGTGFIPGTYTIVSVNPGVSITVNIPCISAPGGANGVGNVFKVLRPIFPADVLNLNPTSVALASGMTVDDVTNYIVQRMYNFVLKSAQEYLGKKYLIELPFVFTKIENGSGNIIHSYDIASAGYIESGVPPLGLSPIFRDNFQDGNNSYEAMCVHSVLSNADLSRIDGGEYTIDLHNGGRIYVKVNVDSEIVFINELTPCAIVTVSNPIYQAPTDGTGAGITVIAGMFQLDPADCAKLMNSLAAGNFFGKIAPLPVNPTGFAIPLKSNILSYGPWYNIGAHGKVNFIHDSGLVPWNYGGSTLMNLAGQAKVQEAITYQQMAESGSVELVGAPIFNIGDQLQIISNALLGPTVTSLDIRYSDKGVTTTYRFQTFSSPRLGTRYKGDVERYRKAAILNNKLNRDARQLWRQALLPSASVVSKGLSVLAASHLKSWPNQLQRNSPHSCFVGMVSGDGVNPTLRRTSITTVSDNEIIASINSKVNYYPRIAAMSITGIIRPFSTDYANTEMAAYESPNLDTNYADALDGQFLNPFKTNNDIELYISGSTYGDAHAYLNGGPSTNVKGFALRGPLEVTGWGWCTDDAFVPNSSPSTLTGGPLTNYLRKSWLWKTGAVDLLWDDERKLWTSHGFMLGKTITKILADGSAKVELWSLRGKILGRKKDRTVYNYLSRDIPASTKIQACWSPESTAWVVVSADCP